MRRNSDLEALLKDWGRQYGGGRYGGGHGGGSWLASMIRWGGRAPEGLGAAPDWTQADDVDEAVRALSAQDWNSAQVIRIEYTLPGQPREAKRQKLARMGIQIGDVRYCQHLRLAKIHVAAWLRVPFVEPMDMQGAVEMLEFIVAADAARQAEKTVD